MENYDCIFCKIANGEIPSNVLYEDNDFKVILDLNPSTRGHALIIPKKHCADLYELSDEIAAKTLVLAKKMAISMTKALNCNGFNLIQNNGEIAGQTVFHFHLHLIPRYDKDGLNINPKQNTITDSELQEILNAVRHQLSSNY